MIEYKSRSPAVERISYTHFIGIDPGAKGSIVVMRRGNGTGIDSGTSMIRTHRFTNATDHDTASFLSTYSRVSTDDPLRAYAYIEDVRGYIGENSDPLITNRKTAGSANATRMFTFGKSYGTIIGILTALGIPYSTTLPQEWQRHYGMKRERDETDSQWKRRLWEKAKELYPAELPDKFQLDLGDATLIAGFCRSRLTE